MRKLLLIFLFNCVIFMNCKEIKEFKYSNGQLKEQYFVKLDKQGNYVKDGKYICWYKSGQKQAIGQYKNQLITDTAKGNTGILLGGRDGKWVFWYENGQKNCELVYKDRKLITDIEWHENGTQYVDYGEAPLGVAWCSSFKETNKILSKKFAFFDSSTDAESTFVAHYKGMYLNYSKVKVEVDYFHDSLSVLAIIIPKQREFPISRTWYDLIEKIKNKYNEPDSINFLQSTNDYQVLDYSIQDGSWQPYALWKFKDVSVLCQADTFNVTIFWFQQIQAIKLLQCFYSLKEKQPKEL
jgi:MORN repeat variant